MKQDYIELLGIHGAGTCCPRIRLMIVSNGRPIVLTLRPGGYASFEALDVGFNSLAFDEAIVMYKLASDETYDAVALDIGGTIVLDYQGP